MNEVEYCKFATPLMKLVYNVRAHTHTQREMYNVESSLMSGKHNHNLERERRPQLCLKLIPPFLCVIYLYTLLKKLGFNLTKFCIYTTLILLASL